MKILLITESLDVDSGWGRYSHDLARHLIHNGSEVVVVCCARNDKVDIEQIVGLPNPLSFTRSYIFSWKYAWSIFRALKNKEIDCVHSAVEPFAFIAYLVSRTLKKPYIVTCHGTYALTTLLNNPFSLLQRIAYAGASRIICVSNYTRQRLLELMPLHTLQVIPNAIDEKEFRVRSDSSPKKNRIITVGAVKHRKGQSVTVEALSLVRKTISDIHYCIVGDQRDFEYVSSLKQKIQSLGLNDAVSFYEHVDEKELSDLYVSSKILVLPAMNESASFEGFGLVYLEANAFGLPVIGSRNNGAEEAIRDGSTGFLIDQGDVEGLAEKIILLLSDLSLYAKMSEQAKVYAASMTWFRIIEKYLAEYREVVS